MGVDLQKQKGRSWITKKIVRDSISFSFASGR